MVTELQKDPQYSAAIDEIITETTEDKFHIESFLSNVEEKKNIIGQGTLNGLNKQQFTDLADQIKQLIHDQVSIHNQNIPCICVLL